MELRAERPAALNDVPLYNTTIKQREGGSRQLRRCYCGRVARRSKLVWHATSMVVTGGSNGYRARGKRDQAPIALFEGEITVKPVEIHGY